MRIGIFVNTPAQLHFYKNICRRLESHGHKTYIVARDYGETNALLDELRIAHYIYSRPPVSKLGKVLALPLDVLKAYRYLKSKKVGLVTGFGVYDVCTSKILGVPSLIFSDSEPLVNTISYAIQYKLYVPLAGAIITPSSFRQDFGRKQIRVESYKELAYLHPRYFTPDEGIYGLLGLEKGEDYVLLRFNAFDAVHDFGVGGFSDADKVRLVEELEKHARVFISSEAGVPGEIKNRVIKIPKSRIHDAIHYAKLLVTDTQTMTTEAAILGTPTVRCNRFVGKSDMGNFIELEEKYGLIFNYREPGRSIQKALELVQRLSIKAEWRQKREKLLRDKADITSFIVTALERFPDGVRKPEGKNMAIG